MGSDSLTFAPVGTLPRMTFDTGSLLVFLRLRYFWGVNADKPVSKVILTVIRDHRGFVVNNLTGIAARASAGRHRVSVKMSLKQMLTTLPRNRFPTSPSFLGLNPSFACFPFF